MSGDIRMRKFSRRSFLGALGATAALPILAACQPQIVEKVVERPVVVNETVSVETAVDVEKVIEKPVEVEKEVTRVVQEVVEVEKEKIVVLEVEKIVEVEVEKEKPSKYVIAGQKATPVPAPVTIEVIHWGGETSQSYKNFEEFARRFEEEHPNVTVKNTPVGSQAIWEQVAMIRFKEGDAPEVMHSGGKGIDVGYVGEYWEAGYYWDLTDAMNEPSYDTPGKTWRETIHPNALPYITYTNRFMAFPRELTLLIIRYNKTMFEEFDLQPPKNWDELTNVSETFLQNDIAPFTHAGIWYPEWLIDYPAQRLFGTEGALDAMLGDITFKDAGWVEVAELVQDLIDKEYLIKGFMGMQVEAQQVMYQNKAAMMLEGSWSVGPNDNPDGWDEGVMYYPMVPNGKGEPTMLFGTCNTMNVSRKSKNPELGVEWARLFTSRWAQDINVQTLGRTTATLGVPPPEYGPAAEIVNLFLNSKEVYQTYFNMWGASPEGQPIFRKQVDRFLGGELNPEQFVDALDTELGLKGGLYEKKGKPKRARPWEL